jgi:hypothetical protein
MNPLNSPVEVGVRALVLLLEAFPERLDVAQLVYLDYAMLHSAELGGPTSLHPELPAGPGELGMRRRLMEQGLQVIIRAGLADLHATDAGFFYVATEEASSFVDVLEASYVQRLVERAEWITTTYSTHGNDVRDAMKQITARWSTRFAASAAAEGADA